MFKQRLTIDDAPLVNNPYYVSYKFGGLNDGIIIDQTNGSVLPNCTSYAMGRFMEVQGLTKTIHPALKNGGLIYLQTSDGYQRGLIPQEGALICWEEPGKAGHVGFVEKIKSDGSLVVSNSGYRGRGIKYNGKSPHFFIYSSLKPSNNYVPSGSNYKFQGFIYNPMMAIPGFVNAILGDTIGQALSAFQVASVSPAISQQSTLFICASLQRIPEIPEKYHIVTSSATKLLSELKSAGAKWITDTSSELLFCPRKYDLILIRNRGTYEYQNENVVDQIGIVKQVVDSTIHYVCGGSTGNYKEESITTATCTIGDPKIYGYLRLTEDGNQYEVISSTPYEFSRNIALIRETGFVSNLNKPSILTGTVKWSVINYMSGVDLVNNVAPKLASVASKYRENQSYNGTTETDAINYLKSLSFNAASSSAILGVLNVYSQLNPNYNLNGQYGIGRWKDKDELSRYVGINWNHNLSGQLDYLLYRITKDDAVLISQLYTTSNLINSALNLAEKLKKYFKMTQSIESSVKSVWDRIQLILR